MSVSTRVPLNTMLADLDETLRRLLRREFEVHGFDGLDIAFEAPTREWSAALSTPTVDLFLYDLRDSRDLKPMDWERREENGRTVETRPPLRLEASYAITAWTREVEDEHRVLSQVLSILYAYPELPADLLAGTLADQPVPRYPLHTRVAQPRSQGSPEFWSAVGGAYKASVDFAVTLSCVPGTIVERGPEVRTQVIRMRDRDGPRGTLEETHRVGGVVRDAEGRPVEDAWVLLPDAGLHAVSDRDGRFRLDRLRSGTHTCVARAPDGAVAQTRLTVPGPPLDLVVTAPGSPPAPPAPAE